MRMTLLDWIPLAVLLGLILTVVFRMRIHARSVPGFLAANRCAGRYLVAVAFNMAQVGIITLVWFFQQYYDAGFTSIWWGLVENPVMIVIALTGWVAYRFRETRALTLAQFLEVRYSRPFRVFCGIVAYFAGVLNYAIFPAVSARFFMWICGFPEELALFGHLVPTFPVLMGLLLGTAIFLVFLGGQVAVMVTDCLQGIYCNITFLVVIAYLLVGFGWESIGETLLLQPDGRSMVDPLGIREEEQFNLWYWLIAAFTLFYTMRAWQGDAGYNAAAITPHEAKMATILSGWRWRVLMLVALVIPVCVKVFLTHPEYAAEAAAVHATIESLPTDALRAEARVPLALGIILPAGLLGLFVAAMFGAYLSTDDTYLHSWGSMMVQDVILPIRAAFTDAELSPGAHLRLLRLSILVVALFAFGFGLVYTPNQYVAMWGALTASVWVAAAGSVIIGGLYWSRGTATAAWWSMGVGIAFSAWGILVKDHLWALETILAPFEGTALDAVLETFRSVHGNRWISGQVLAFAAMALSIATYVGISLLGRGPRFDLDRMLFRGPYRELLPPSERDFREEDAAAARGQPPAWMRKLGFSREYDRADTWITAVTVAWPLLWTGVFVAGTAYAATVGVSERSWLAFWEAWTWLVFATGCVIVAWFTVGSLRDLVRMKRHLERYRADDRDDGTVRERIG